jgi:hypothetical protein
MIKEKIMDLLLEISEKFKGITKAHYEYYKAATYEQFVVVVSALSIISILFFLFGLFLVFLTFGLAFLIGFWLGNYAYGFFAMAALYMFLGLLVYNRRGPWIVNSVVRILEKVFYSNESILDSLIKREKNETSKEE